MAKKGDRAKLEPVVKGMYISGTYTPDEIKQATGVSKNSQKIWRDSHIDPKTGVSSWDYLRDCIEGLDARLIGLYDREIRAAEKTEAGKIPQAILQSIAQLGGSVKQVRQEELRKIEKVASMLLESQDSQVSGVDYPAVFLEMFEWLVQELGAIEPDIQRGLIAHMDTLIGLIKEKHLK